MGIKYFDVHCHAHFPAYGGDSDGVVSRAARAGIGFITVGTRKDTSAEAVEFAKRHENVWASIGLHPGRAIESFYDEDELGPQLAGTVQGEQFDFEFFAELAKSKKVVAIGECGLDYAAFVRGERGRLQKRASAEAVSESGLPKESIESRKKKQKKEFIKQIQFACEVKKPLMIHCRDAFGDLIEILNFEFQNLNSLPGAIHFFSGSIDEAKKLLNMGFYFTFGGAITFPPRKNGTDYAEIVKILPMEKILSETDAPWVAPVPYRGKRNEPAYVIEVVKKLAEIKNVSLDTMRGQILENTTRAFGIDF